jgi:hypothetical protein
MGPTKLHRSQKLTRITEDTREFLLDMIPIVVYNRLDFCLFGCYFARTLGNYMYCAATGQLFTALIGVASRAIKPATSLFLGVTSYAS